MVKSIKPPSVASYFKKLPNGKSVPINRDGSIKEIHDIWSDPIPKPQPKPKEKEPFQFPGVPYEHPPDYIVPKGRGFYGDPAEPPDPQDCDGAMADISPWCGGVPFSKEALSYDPKIAYDECNVWVQLGGTIAFVQMPPKTLAYRFPGKCREEPPPPPPPEPGQSSVNVKYPSGIPADKQVYAFVSVSGSGVKVGRRFNSQTNKFEEYTWTFANDVKWTDYKCPGTYHLEKRYFGSGSNDYTWYDSPIQGNITSSGITDTGAFPETSHTIDWNDNAGGYARYAYTIDGIVVYTDSGSGTTKRYYNQGLTVYGILETISSSDSTVFKGQWGLIVTVLEKNKDNPPTVDEGETINTDISVDFAIDLFCGSPRDRSKLPPPPLDPREPCCMACCNPNPNNDALLKEILGQIKKANKAIGSDSFPVQATIYDEDENKQEAQSKTIRLDSIARSISKIIERNEKISKIIGIDSFPLELPESVIVHPESNIIQKALNFLNPFKNVKIYSLMDLLVWKIKQDSAVLGQWGQTIQVESKEIKKENIDGKVTEKEYTKTEEVVLPNMAQTMKEQVLLQTQLMKNNGLALDCIIKLLIEAAQTKLIVAETVKRVEDIQQYLDYPTNERSVEVPLQISIPNPNDPQDHQNDLYRLLKEGKAKIVFDDWTGEHSQDEKLFDLLQAAKTIQGVYFNKT